MLKLRIPLQRFHKFAKFVRSAGGFSDENMPAYPILFIFFFQGCWNTIQKNADFRKAFSDEVKLLCDKYKKKSKVAEDLDSLN